MPHSSSPKRSATRKRVRSLSEYVLAAVAALSISAATAFAQDTTAKPSIAPAALSGSIHDSTGAPVVDAEVVIRETTRSVRTDSGGRFAVSGVQPGLYQVWFRKLGYASAQYTWAGRAGERTDLAVILHLLPHTLDPVVIRAQEDRRMRGSSTILGYVVDSLGQAVPEAEVQLIGADRTGLTRDNGGFAFRGLPLGTYLVRVRKLGYAPNTVALDLKEGDDRELAIKIRQLSGQLAPVIVSERSGFGRDQVAWDELERRKRWHTSSKDVVAGPEELQRFRGYPFDRMLTLIGVDGAESFAAMKNDRLMRVTSKADEGGAPMTRLGGTDQNDACVLINGRDMRRVALRTFNVEEVELVEIYPSGEDPGGTISPHMSGACRSQNLSDHPTWYVIWLRGAK